MARIIFFQYFWMEQLGIMYLASLLKSKGHCCALAIGTKKDILKKVRKFNPDIAGFTCFTGQEKWAEEIFRGIKQIDKNIVTVIGGPHACFFPELINSSQGINVVCLGEGEYPLLELAESVDQKKSYQQISNFWVKTEQGIKKNPLRRSIADLDTLPFADRQLYREYPFIYSDTTKHLLTSRGCLFSCTYCFNNSIDQLYSDKGGYHRLRSIENVVSELKEIKTNFKPARFYFRDGNFINNKKWLLEFLDRYEKEIQIPYYCHFVASLADEDIVKKLKVSGCYLAAFGVETGNERYRIDVLKKNVSDKQIENISHLLHSYKIAFYTTNMLGLPGENLNQALQTVNLNLRIRPFSAWYSMFVPYPKTALSEYAYRKEYLQERTVKLDKADSYKRSLLKHPQKEYIENLHKFTFVLHLFPKTYPIVLKLIRLPYNVLYEMLYNLTYLLVFVRKSRDWTLSRFLKEAFVALKYYR